MLANRFVIISGNRYQPKVKNGFRRTTRCWRLVVSPCITTSVHCLRYCRVGVKTRSCRESARICVRSLITMARTWCLTWTSYPSPRTCAHALKNLLIRARLWLEAKARSILRRSFLKKRIERLPRVIWRKARSHATLLSNSSLRKSAQKKVSTRKRQDCYSLSQQLHHGKIARCARNSPCAA